MFENEVELRGGQINQSEKDLAEWDRDKIHPTLWRAHRKEKVFKNSTGRNCEQFINECSLEEFKRCSRIQVRSDQGQSSAVWCSSLQCSWVQRVRVSGWGIFSIQSTQSVHGSWVCEVLRQILHGQFYRDGFQKEYPRQGWRQNEENQYKEPED